MQLFLPQTPDSHPLESQLSFNSSPRLLEGLDGSENCLDPGQGSTNQHSYPKAESSIQQILNRLQKRKRLLVKLFHIIIITNQKGAHNHHRLRWLRKSTSLVHGRRRKLSLLDGNGLARWTGLGRV
uniref:Uncharacterized protein n=1 Tax=Picea glauca TaxID=3330 RepID=A0A124GND1_PICGL|nr:hypothetical protein ABT39_MTgene4456 [Picea glauca]QHR91343.1 hypothetical protein Q903MT_gene5375 [Picea sitchensis]